MNGLHKIVVFSAIFLLASGFAVAQAPSGATKNATPSDKETGRVNSMPPDSPAISNKEQETLSEELEKVAEQIDSIRRNNGENTRKNIANLDEKFLAMLKSEQGKHAKSGNFEMVAALQTVVDGIGWVDKKADDAAASSGIVMLEGFAPSVPSDFSSPLTWKNSDATGKSLTNYAISFKLIDLSIRANTGNVLFSTEKRQDDTVGGLALYYQASAILSKGHIITGELLENGADKRSSLLIDSSLPITMICNGNIVSLYSGNILIGFAAIPADPPALVNGGGRFWITREEMKYDQIQALTMPPCTPDYLILKKFGITEPLWADPNPTPETP